MHACKTYSNIPNLLASEVVQYFKKCCKCSCFVLCAYKKSSIALKKAKTFLLQLQLQLGIATVPTTSILMHRCNSCMYPGMYVEVKVDSLFLSLKLS